MNLEAKIIKPKLGLLELSRQLGSVTQACKVFGYRWNRNSHYGLQVFYHCNCVPEEREPGNSILKDHQNIVTIKPMFLMLVRKVVFYQDSYL